MNTVTVRIRRDLIPLLLILIIGLTSAWAQTPNTTQAPIKDLKPTVILVSIDGFRFDYFNRGKSPNLESLITSGVHADGLIPPFPTKTFPSHYTIVTGLYPAHHGIVGNTMYDPALKANFSLNNQKEVTDARWWGGEPIWVTAERQSQKAGTMFWPGSEAAIEGVHPSYCEPYDKSVSAESRVNTVLKWLDLPEQQRPTLLTLYFEPVDTAGHIFGPDSPQVNDAIAEVDHAIGQLLNGLQQRGIANKVNLIVVSDHGMAPVSSDRVVFLDDYIDLKQVHVVDWSPVLLLNPSDGDDEKQLLSALQKMPHVKVYDRNDVPERWHFKGNRRITSIVGIADEGWTITDHEHAKSHPVKGGTHGFDNNLQSMQGIFVARGPAFKAGSTLPAFPNVDVYSLLTYLLDLKPAKNDGTLSVFKPVLEPAKAPARSIAVPASN